MEAAALRLSALAAVVGTALDPVVAHHRPDVWQGGRAVRFGQELVDHRLLHARAALLRTTQALAP